MNTKGIKTLAAVLIIILSVVTFVGCKDKDTKKIILSKNVLVDDLESDKSASQLIVVNDTNTKLSKLKEFKDIAIGYFPICWKDDGNVILLKESTLFADEFSICNLNINTGKISTNTTIRDGSVLVNLIRGLGRKYEPVTSLFYVKDYKLRVYNLLDNTTKEIYDLTGVKMELEKLRANEKEYQKIEKSSDFTIAAHFGNLVIDFIQGSNKYVFIELISPDSIVKGYKILNLYTGNVVDLPSEIVDKMHASSTIVYSKVNDKFYMFPFPGYSGNSKSDLKLNDGFYEFKLDEADSFKKIKNAPIVAQSPIVSEDGRYIYFFSENYNMKTGKHLDSIIFKYNIDYGSFYTLFKSNSKDDIYFSKYNYRNNMFLFWDTQNGSALDKNNYNLALAEDNRIKVISKPDELVNDEVFGSEALIFNKKGDKFIYRSYPMGHLNEKPIEVQKLIICGLSNLKGN